MIRGKLQRSFQKSTKKAMQRSGRRHLDAFSVCEEGGELQDVDEQEHSSARMRISLSNKMNCYFLVLEEE